MRGRVHMRVAAFILMAIWSCPLVRAAAAPRSFAVSGHTNYGNWTGDVRFSPTVWKPGDTVTVDATLKLVGRHLQTLSADLNMQPDNFVLLVTAERIFDANGILRLPSDQTMSTLITPTG